MIPEIREASWTAPALPPSRRAKAPLRRDGGWRFARKRKIRRISPELFCANDNLICHKPRTRFNCVHVHWEKW